MTSKNKEMEVIIKADGQLTKTKNLYNAKQELDQDRIIIFRG